MYMSVLILNREQVKQVISMKEVIQEVREVYRLKSQGKSVIWPLVNYEFVDEHAAMDIRSGYIKGVQLHGLKMLNNFPENREKGLPPFNGIMMVYDSNTGIPVSVMDASYVTCMRTVAAGALALPAATSATQAAPAFGLAATTERAPSLVDLDATRTGSITIHKLVKDDTNGTTAGNGLKDDTATGEQ